MLDASHFDELDVHGSSTSMMFRLICTQIDKNSIGKHVLPGETAHPPDCLRAILHCLQHFGSGCSAWHETVCSCFIGWVATGNDSGPVPYSCYALPNPCYKLMRFFHTLSFAHCSRMPVCKQGPKAGAGDEAHFTVAWALSTCLLHLARIKILSSAETMRGGHLAMEQARPMQHPACQLPRQRSLHGFRAAESRCAHRSLAGWLSSRSRFWPCMSIRRARMLFEGPENAVGPSNGDAITPIYTMTLAPPDKQPCERAGSQQPTASNEYLLEFTGGHKVSYVAESVNSSQLTALVCVCMLDKEHSKTM